MSVCNVIKSKAKDIIVSEGELFLNPELYPGLWQSAAIDDSKDYIIISRNSSDIFIPVRLSADSYDMLWSSAYDRAAQSVFSVRKSTCKYRYVGEIDKINIHVKVR